MKVPFARVENFCVPEKDDGTVVMKAVWLDVEGERLLATNGHMAVRVSVGVEPEDVSGVVPVEAFQLARKELKAISKVMKEALPDPWLSVVCGEETISITNLLTNTAHLVVRPKLASDEKKFPNIDAIVPELRDKPAVSLSAVYLAEIIKGLDGDGLSLWLQGDEKTVIMASAAGEALIALMPRKEHVDVELVNKRGAKKGLGPVIAEVINTTTEENHAD